VDRSKSLFEIVVDCGGATMLLMVAMPGGRRCGTAPQPKRIEFGLWNLVPTLACNAYRRAAGQNRVLADSFERKPADAQLHYLAPTYSREQLHLWFRSARHLMQDLPESIR
jgi:hypothetical protein